MGFRIFLVDSELMFFLGYFDLNRLVVVDVKKIVRLYFMDCFWWFVLLVKLIDVGYFYW